MYFGLSRCCWGSLPSLRGMVIVHVFPLFIGPRVRCVATTPAGLACHLQKTVPNS